MNVKNDVSFKKQFQEAMLTPEFSGSWLLEHALLSHPQKADPSSPNTPSNLSYLQAHTSRSPVLFLLSHPILSPWDMLMIIPLLTPSPSDLSFPTTPPSDRLWHWKPKRSQRTPVKCSLEGEWKGILHPAQPLGTIFPAQILEGEGRGTTCPRGSQRCGRKPPESEGQQVSWDPGQVLSQILTGLLPFGSYDIPGGIKSSRDWDPAREETRSSSGNTAKCFCHRCTSRQPALASEMPHSKMNILKWCILNI